jgi:hypothetical protein
VDNAPLHIKIALSHHERTRHEHKLRIELSELKTAFMTRQRLLTQLDPEGRFEYNAPQMRELIRQYAEEYKRNVLKMSSVQSRSMQFQTTPLCSILGFCAHVLQLWDLLWTLHLCGYPSLCVAFSFQGASAVGLYRSNRVRQDEMQVNWQYGC